MSNWNKPAESRPTCWAKWPAPGTVYVGRVVKWDPVGARLHPDKGGGPCGLLVLWAYASNGELWIALDLPDLRDRWAEVEAAAAAEGILPLDLDVRIEFAEVVRPRNWKRFDVQWRVADDSF